MQLTLPQYAMGYTKLNRITPKFTGGTVTNSARLVPDAGMEVHKVLPPAAYSRFLGLKREVSELAFYNLIGSIIERITFVDRSRVFEYLSSHRKLSETLYHSLSHIRNFFGPNFRVFADVIEDEDTGGVTDLYVAIETDLSVKEGMEALDLFRSNWLYKKPRRVWSGLTYDVKFR